MPALKIEAVAGLHPYGSLDALHAFRRDGQTPFLERGVADCPADAFAKLKTLGPALRRTPRLARLALAAVLDLPHFQGPNAGRMATSALVVATAFGSVASTFAFMDSLLADGPDLASPTAFSHSVTNMPAAMLGQHLRLAGPAMTVTDAEGRPFQAALFAAAGLLETAAADTVVLCAVEERHPVLDAILAANAGMPPAMEGAAAFVLSRGAGGAGSRIVVPSAAATVGVHGPGPLAVAWNVALAFLALRDDSRDGRDVAIALGAGTC